MSGSSIFDGIMGDMSSLGDALGSAVAGSGLLKGGVANSQTATEAAEIRAFRIENLLNANKTNYPYGPQSFQAGKSQQTPTVNSDVVNQQWLQRLNRYSSMPQFEGAKAKGA